MRFFMYTLLFLISSFPAYAIIIQGTDTSSNIYTSDSAQGSIVEQQVLSADNTYNSSIFSNGGPVKNGTNAADLSISGFGISESGDVYIVTTGPELAEAVAATAIPAIPASPASEGSSVPSSGSGGGGGSSSRDTYGLIVGDTITVFIDQEEHTITITQIYEDSAVLTIDGREIIELQVQETQEIDVDEDGIMDMSITVDAVSELKELTITVVDLTQQETIAEEILEQEQPASLERITAAVSAVPVEQIVETSAAVGKKTGILLTYVIGLNLIAGLLVASVVATKKLQQRRIYNVFHAQSREQLIQQELAKVQKYVSSAIDAGTPVVSLKEQLLGVGWQEYEIDSIMVDAMLKEEEFFNQIR